MPVSPLNITHLIAFLTGTATGAAGTYLADKYTDQRRKKEATRALLKTYRELDALMPELFEEIRQDIQDDGSGVIREFVVMSSRDVKINHSRRRFEYFENEHPDLMLKIGLLVDARFINDVTVDNVPIYKMNEHFVSLLRKQ